MYLKSDKLVITLGKVVMRSYSTGLGPQYILDPTAMVGWTDGVDVRRNSTIRPTSSGDFPDKSTNSTRSISISGTAIATSVSELHQMRDDMVGLLVDGNYSTLSVLDGVGTRYSMVGLGSKTNWIQITDTVATWKLELFAPDPRIYGDIRIIQLSDSTINGGLDTPINYPLDFGVPVERQSQFIENQGNIEAWPIFVVSGDYFSGFSVTDNLGNIVTYTGPISLASPVTIDTSSGSASQGGVDRSTFIISRQWWSVPPQELIQPAFKPIQAATGWCDIIYRDTWI